MAFCESWTVFQLSLGCGLLSGGPQHGHPGLLTNTAVHCIPSCSLTAEADPEMSASFLGHQGGAWSRQLEPVVAWFVLCFGLCRCFTIDDYYIIWTVF